VPDDAMVTVSVSRRFLAKAKLLDFDCQLILERFELLRLGFVVGFLEEVRIVSRSKPARIAAPQNVATTFG
jgi:hypothetical protein